jgi:hypothetical protein
MWSEQLERIDEFGAFDEGHGGLAWEAWSTHLLCKMVKRRKKRSCQIMDA